MELYGVKKEYCDFAEEGMHTIFANKHDDYERVLTPRYDGDYTL